MSVSSKEITRSKIGSLVKRWTETRAGDFTEQDTATNFILPFLEALGWNIYDVYEVKQWGYPVILKKSVPVEERSLKKPDCVVSLNNKPYMVFEFKPLADGGAIDRYTHRIDRLKEKAQYLNVVYAILTNFTETIGYDADGNELIRFKRPPEYTERFDELWKFLSKEAAVLRVSS